MPHVLKFGVLSEASRPERDLLALADQYRLALHASHLAEHRATVDFRNERFPGLWQAMQEWERAKAKCYVIERAIKQLHSEVRDRNAVTVEQDEQLRLWREAAKQAKATVLRERQPWYGLDAVYQAALRQAADWKNVKTVERRAGLYGELDWTALVRDAAQTAQLKIAGESDDAKRQRLQNWYDRQPWDVDTQLLADYAAIKLSHDMDRRRLSREYQERGLGSGTRGEIDAATKPKTSRTGPGTRYRYHSRELPRPWTKLVLQFVGGLTVEDARNRSTQFRIADHPRKNSFRATQQIGTAALPVTVEYVFRAHRPLMPDDVIQRAALVIEQEADDTRDGYWRRSLHLTVKRDLPDKCKGTEPLHVRLRWTRVEGGCLVAEFRSPIANENLILPDWILRRRMAVDIAQAEADSKANDLLAELGVTVTDAHSSGFAAVEDYLREHENEELKLWVDKQRRQLRRARRIRTWSIRTIESIYQTVTSRMAELHGSLLLAELDIASIKRYDTRDLLRADVLPPASRTLLHAVAPGKLKAALSRALPASDEVEGDNDGVARESDIFRSYVRSLGPRGGRQSRCGSRRSHRGAQAKSST